MSEFHSYWWPQTQIMWEQLKDFCVGTPHFGQSLIGTCQDTHKGTRQLRALDS